MVRPGNASTSGAPSGSLPANALPLYVQEALRGLTRAQRTYVKDGCIHGDCTMTTIRALQRKALFYLKITSPNGRCGFMALTPLGETVQRILKERALGNSEARNAAEGAPPPDVSDEVPGRPS